jgi:D-glycero-D-manno-heptose 1,7-bisphosphate phosphatase
MKCIFLDRDGVLNKDFVDYAYTPERFIILDGVKEGLQMLKEAGYLLVVVTNQSGIAKGIYTKEAVLMCHQLLQAHCGHIIDDLYYAPYHPSVTASLTRKPDTLMFERAIAKYGIDVKQSWMFGDKERDMTPAKKLGIPTVLVGHEADPSIADLHADDLLSAAKMVLSRSTL